MQKLHLKGNLVSSDDIHIEPEKKNALSFQDNSLLSSTSNKILTLGKKANRNNVSIGLMK